MNAASQQLRPWLFPALATVALVAIDRAHALGPGLLSLVDYRASNIGDPWPTVVAARAMLDHPFASLYSGFSAKGSSFIYPPVAALLVVPFARLSYDGAHLALSVVSRAAYVACVALTFVIARDRGTRLAALVGATFVALAFYPLLRAVELNQSTLVVAACFGGALLAASRGRDKIAGVLVGLTAAIKPQMAVVVLLLFWHSRRLVMAGIAAMAAMGVLSVASAGVSNHVEYVSRILPRLASGYAFYPNQSWSGAILRLSGEPFRDFALPTPSITIKVIATVANVATLAIAAIVLRAAARRPEARDAGALVRAMGFAWLAVTLASPISWEHHYTPCIFLYAFLLATYPTWPRRARLAALTSFPLIAGYIEVRGWSGPLGRLASSYVLVGALLLATTFALGLDSDPDGARIKEGALAGRP